MALDVYVVDGPNHEPGAGFPSCQFEDGVHDFIFHGCGIDVYNRYAYLRRMIDFYADAEYTGDAICSLISEIDDILPHVTAMTAAVDALTAFRAVCIAARDADKSVFLYCD